MHNKEARLNEARKEGAYRVRLSPTDSITVFVPDGESLPPELEERCKMHGPPRREAVDGGHLLSLPVQPHDLPEDLAEGGFKITPGGWEESCHVCKQPIKSGTTCGGIYGVPLRLLCEACFAAVKMF